MLNPDLFVFQLSSLYEVRPPISRAKMANVTKCAIKAIKFYKHVVQSVEKFIQKVCFMLYFQCIPVYSIPHPLSVQVSLCFYSVNTWLRALFLESVLCFDCRLRYSCTQMHTFGNTLLLLHCWHFVKPTQTSVLIPVLLTVSKYLPLISFTQFERPRY